MLEPSGIRAAAYLAPPTHVAPPMSLNSPSSSQKNWLKTRPSTLWSYTLSILELPLPLPHGVLPADAAQMEGAWGSLHPYSDENAVPLIRGELHHQKYHSPTLHASPCHGSPY